MTTKVLSVEMKGVDRLTPAARAAARSVVGIGEATQRMERTAVASTARTSRAFVSLGKALTGALAVLGVGAGVGVAVRSINRAAEELDRLGLAARRTGASVQTLSLLRYLGQRIGQDVQDVTDLVGDLNERISEAVRFGSGRGVETIRRLGIEARDLEGNLRPTDDLLFETIEKINAIGDAPTREFFTKELFGDEAARFLPFFNQGLEQLQMIRREAQSLGVIFTPEQVAAATLYRQGLQRVQAALDGLKARIIGLAGEGIGVLLTRLASILAAIPEIAGNAIELVRQLLTGTATPEVGQWLATLALYVGSFITGLIEDIARIIVIVGSVVLRQALMLLVQGLGQDAANEAVVWGARIGAGMAAGARQAISGLFTGDGAAEIAAAAASGAAAAEAVVRPTLRAAGGVDTAGLGLDPATSIELARLLGDATSRSGAALGDITAILDKLLGISAAMAKTNVEAGKFADVLGQINGSGDGTSEPNQDNLLGGISAGLEGIRTQARQLYTFGEQLVQGIAQQVSGSLATAFVDAISGVRSFGEAMRDVFSQVLRYIAEAVLRMAVLRAISAGLGLFGVSDGTATAAQLVPTLANRGRAGVTRQRSMSLDDLGIRSVHAQSGAAALARLVPGPAVGRDIIPAMLTPGESVLTAQATRRIGIGNIARANLGGEIGPSGGGQAGVVYQISVAPVIQVQGKMDERARGDIGREIAEAVVTRIEASPALRGRVRAVATGRAGGRA